MTCAVPKAVQKSLIALAILLSLAATPAMAKDKLPEVDSHGLHRVANSEADLVYARPGADLGSYTQVMLVDCFVQFKKNWERDYNMGEVGLEGRVRDKDMERIKKELAEAFNEVFNKVLTEKGYTVVDAPAAGVLAVRPAIVNLDVSAPDLKRSSPGLTYVQSAGSMTLYMELYDAASDELIGRVVDSKFDPDQTNQVANSVTNRSAATRILRNWAEQLADHLGEVTQ